MTAGDELIDAITSLCVLFCAIVELALNPPIGPMFKGLNRNLSWHDFHPGWRFVYAVQSMSELVSTDASRISEWLANPDVFQDEICDRLGWPRRLAMLQELGKFADGNFDSISYGYTTTDSNRLVPRIYHVILGLARTCAWLPRVVVGPRSMEAWRRGKAKSDLIRSALSPELLADQSVTVNYQTGRCMWAVHEKFTDQKMVDLLLIEREREALLEQLVRPLELAYTITSYFFYLHILRMAIIGSAGCPVGNLMLNLVCSERCTCRKSVDDACKQLVDSVWELWIYR